MLKVRQHAIGMARGVYRAFLRDMRRRLGFSVLATPDDQYDVPELTTPFFEWVMTHPRVEILDWQQTVSARKQALEVYWQKNKWVDVADAEIEHFVGTVRQLTVLFECSNCSQLLSYDDHETYYCSECNEQTTMLSKSPAYWFVKK